MNGSRTNPVFVALDTPDLSKALAIAKAVKPYVGGLKVGFEFMTALGPDAIRAIVDTGVPVFTDTKFHDIPNTVGGAAREIAKLGAVIFNVHASGGHAMMKAAADEARAINPKMKIIAVTVLTSLDDSDLEATGQRGPAEEQVVRLAKLTKAATLDGVVCSSKEIGAIRKACGADFKLIVPGIRPAGADIGDQKRVMTPTDAVRAGADILVIGRPITGAADPAAAAKAIWDDLSAVPAA
jgi:orotidine-5'-phosphate decarboxylase